MKTIKAGDIKLRQTYNWTCPHCGTYNTEFDNILNDKILYCEWCYQETKLEN